MSLNEVITLATRYDGQLKTMEDKAINRMNKALDGAYSSLEKQFMKSYPNIASNATLLAAQRKALILDELGDLLQIVNPDDQAMYEDTMGRLIQQATNLGGTGGNRLIEAMNGAHPIKAFAEVPIEAVASSATNTYNRLVRWGEAYADNATNIISQGLIQGWDAKKLVTPLRQQLGVTKDKALQIARTESISAYADASEQSYREAEIEGVLWIALGDKRVCFPTGTLISTARGAVPIEQVKEGEEVLTRYGYRKVVRTIKSQYSGDMVKITVGNKVLTATGNHPIWTTEGWTQARKIDNTSIVQTDNNCFAQVDRVENHFIGEPHKRPTRLIQNFCFSSISSNVLNSTVPVRTINFYSNLDIWQSKINTVSSKRILLNVVNTQTIEAFSYPCFPRSFADIGSITRNITKSSFIDITGHISELAPAMQTTTVNRWAVAFLRAIIISTISLKNFATSLTWLGLMLRKFLLAIEATVIVPVSSTGRNSEFLLASYTDFCDMWRPTMVTGNVTVKPFASDKFRLVSTKSFLTSLASHGLFSQASTILITALHRAKLSTFVFSWYNKIIQALFTIDGNHNSNIGSVSYYDQDDRGQVPLSSITVYNLTVEEHPEYYANGILVHNCGYCLGRHMRTYRLGSMRPPLHPSCRCTTAPVNLDWINNGIVDTKTMREERKRAIAESGVEPSNKPAPFERLAGLQKVEAPIFEP